MLFSYWPGQIKHSLFEMTILFDDIIRKCTRASSSHSLGPIFAELFAFTNELCTTVKDADAMQFAIFMVHPALSPMYCGSPNIS